MKIPILKNTLTNYLGMVLRLLQGVLVTRWLIALLGPNRFGLWSILWTFFCYSLLLDFGLGVAAQKATATELWKTDIRKYNMTVSTVFVFYLAMAVLIVAGTLVASCFVEVLFHLGPEDPVSYCRQALILFGIGSAALFPMGIFSEILVGLQKIYLRNYVQLVSKILEIGGTFVIFMCGGGLYVLIAFTLTLMFFTQFCLMVAAWRSIPGFRLRLRLNWGIFRAIFNFSGSVYFVSLARMIWGRCPAMLISAFCGLSSVSIYAIGLKPTLLLGHVVLPAQENISPVAALLHHRSKKKELADFLMNSMRWNAFLATGATIAIVVFTPALIRFLFHCEDGLSAKDFGRMIYVCRYSTISVWLWLVFREIPCRALIMAEHHVLLAVAGVVEMVVFLAASFGIFFGVDTWSHDLRVVMWASILSRLIVVFVLVVPSFLKIAEVKFFTLMMRVVVRPLAVAFPTALLAIAEYRFLEGRVDDFLQLMIAMTTCGPLYVLSTYFLLLSPHERRRVPLLSKIFRGST